MGIVTFFGMIISLGCVVAGIIMLGGDLAHFLDAPSVLLTIVPTVGALLATVPLNQIAKIPSHLAVLMKGNKFSPAETVATLSDLAKKARVNGLLALESETESLKDPFFRTAINLLVDGNEADRIEESLESILDGVEERHSKAWVFYDKGASYAPAFGMVATLVSLVNMLMALDFSDAGGVASLGVNMSAALITTFYGSLMANVLFMPIATRLRSLHKDEMFAKTLIIDGVCAMQRGVNPKALNSMLAERLDPKLAKKVGLSAEGA